VKLEGLVLSAKDVDRVWSVNVGRHVDVRSYVGGSCEKMMEELCQRLGLVNLILLLWLGLEL
jgi:hypothetical protein